MNTIERTKSRAVMSAISGLSKEVKTINVPALVVVLRGKNISTEIENLRRLLRNGHEAELLPRIYISQDDHESGPHILTQLCAVTTATAEQVPPTDYPKYESMEAEWVVLSGNTYESALPRVDNALTDVQLVAASEHGFVTVTLIPNESLR